MKIEGSIQANLMSAIVSCRRLCGQRVHRDTIAYWHSILEQGRRNTTAPFDDDVANLVNQLELQLAQFSKSSGDPTEGTATSVARG